MPLLRARFALLVAVTLAGPMLAVACSNQAEGERCDRNNEDEDCQDGLVCTSSQVLGGSADICCPENLGDSENAACIPGGGATSAAATTTTGTTVTTSVSSSSSGGEGGAGGEGGTSPAGTGGAGGDTSAQGGGGAGQGGAGGQGGSGG